MCISDFCLLHSLLRMQLGILHLLNSVFVSVCRVLHDNNRTLCILGTVVTHASDESPKHNTESNRFSRRKDQGLNQIMFVSLTF